MRRYPRRTGERSTRWADIARSRIATHGLRFVVFSLVGASGVIVNFAILTLLVEAGSWNPLLAGVAATEGAILSNFVLNDRWTFRDARLRMSWPRRLVRYHAITFGGLLISVTTLAVLIQLAGIHYLVANLGAIAGATLWNYGGSFRFTWSMGASEDAVTVTPAPSLAHRSRRLVDAAVSQISKVLP